MARTLKGNRSPIDHLITFTHIDPCAMLYAVRCPLSAVDCQLHLSIQPLLEFAYLLPAYNKVKVIDAIDLYTQPA